MAVTVAAVLLLTALYGRDATRHRCLRPGGRYTTRRDATRHSISAAWLSHSEGSAGLKLAYGYPAVALTLMVAAQIGGHNSPAPADGLIRHWTCSAAPGAQQAPELRQLRSGPVPPPVLVVRKARIPRDAG
jgi:hypothetical protein